MGTAILVGISIPVGGEFGVILALLAGGVMFSLWKSRDPVERAPSASN